MPKRSLYDSAARRIAKTERAIDQDAFFERANKRFEQSESMYDELEQRYNTENVVGKQTFFYVMGVSPKKGKLAILGPFTSAREADDAATTLLDPEIFELKTKDLSKATREIKALILERTEDADKALERVKHQKSLDRERD